MGRKSKRKDDDVEQEKDSKSVSLFSTVTWLATCVCAWAISRQLKLGWELVAIEIFLMWAGNSSSGRISSQDSVRLVRELVRPVSILASRVRVKNLFSDLPENDHPSLDDKSDDK